MASTGIRIAGFGGQGVILAGMVIGKAVAIHDGKFATLTQSFGPEARGSACSAQLIVSDEPILYPYLMQPDILVVMSQEASRLFGSDLKPGGLLLYEQDLIHLDNTTQGMSPLWNPGDALRGGIGPQAGAQHGDGRLCYRARRTRHAPSRPQSHCRFRTQRNRESEPRRLRKRPGIRPEPGLRSARSVIQLSSQSPPERH